MKGFLLGTLGVILAFVIPLGILKLATKLLDTTNKKQHEDKENQGR